MTDAAVWPMSRIAHALIWRPNMKNMMLMSSEPRVMAPSGRSSRAGGMWRTAAKAVTVNTMV